MKTYFGMRESLTTIALLKSTFTSTGSRMWSGDSLCLRAFFQSPPIDNNGFIITWIDFSEIQSQNIFIIKHLRYLKIYFRTYEILPENSKIPDFLPNDWEI